MLGYCRIDCSDWGVVMIREELNELYWLNKEIQDLKRRLKELEENTPIGSAKITGLPKGSSQSNQIESYIEKVDALKRKINENMILVIEEKKKIEDFIATVDDAEMRMIIRLRNIDLMGWQEIGDALGMERTTASKKYNSFLKKLKHKIDGKNI